MALRTALIFLLVLLCIYIAWLAVRWRRVQKQARAAGLSGDRHANIFRDIDRFGSIPVGDSPAGIHSHHADAGPVGMTVDTEEDDSVVSLTPQSTAMAAQEESAAPIPARTPRPSEPDASGFGFDALLEVRQMRHLIDELRSQQSRLNDDLARLRDELSALRAASRVAPAYAEAVSMVQRGLDAQAIAERCGISVAEAELVRALSEQRAQPGDADEPVGEASHEHADEQQQYGNRGDMHG